MKFIVWLKNPKRSMVIGGLIFLNGAMAILLVVNQVLIAITGKAIR